MVGNPAIPQKSTQLATVGRAFGSDDRERRGIQIETPVEIRRDRLSATAVTGGLSIADSAETRTGAIRRLRPHEEFAASSAVDRRVETI